MISNIYFLGKDGEKSRKRRGKEIVNVRFDLCFGINRTFILGEKKRSM